MRYRVVFSFLLSFIFLISCNKKQDLTFEIIHTTEEDYGCTIECPEISIQKLEALSHSKETKTVAENINKSIEEHIVYSISSYTDETEGLENTKEAVKKFIASYQKDKKEFPDMAAHYKASIESKKTHDTKNLLSLRMFTHLYTGGAHGYSSVSYLNFDPHTGQAIAVEQMLLDTEAFILFVEKKFREAYDIPKNSSINSTRFMFEGDVFILPSSMGFDQDYMLFTYNPYEIAPYSEGLIELKIPIHEVQAFINRKL